MQVVTTITTKGQVTIPEHVRQSLAISIGDKVAFINIKKEKKETTLRIIPTRVVDQLSGSLKTPIPYIEHAKARKRTAQLRAQRYT